MSDIGKKILIALLCLIAWSISDLHAGQNEDACRFVLGSTHASGLRIEGTNVFFYEGLNEDFREVRLSGGVLSEPVDFLNFDESLVVVASRYESNISVGLYLKETGSLVAHFILVGAADQAITLHRREDEGRIFLRAIGSRPYELRRKRLTGGTTETTQPISTNVFGRLALYLAGIENRRSIERPIYQSEGIEYFFCDVEVEGSGSDVTITVDQADDRVFINRL